MKRKMILFIMIALLFLIGGKGCEKENNVTDIFHTWKFQGFGNTVNNYFEKAIPADCGGCYQLTFSTDGKIYGRTSINSISGLFTINGENLKLSELILTEIFERGNGNKYCETIPLVESYKIENGKLRLYYNQGKGYLLFNLIN